MSRSIAIALAGVLLLSAASADTQGGADPALELMKSSGVYDQLGEIPTTIEAQLEATQSSSLPLDARNALESALREAYAVDALRASALATLRRGIGSEHYRTTASWLASERGRRITELEKQASGAQAVREMQAYTASLRSTPPPRGRVTKVQVLSDKPGARALP